jgi:hypothetical protein
LPLPNINVIGRKTGCFADVASMREIRDECKILAGISEGNQLLGTARHRRENNSKMQDHRLSGR